MYESTRHSSHERYLTGSIGVSISIAAVMAQIPGAAFDKFVPMAAILVAADIIVYAAVKLGIIRRKSR